MWYATTQIILTSGSAQGGTELNAFDNGLRAACIADFNLLKVTSITPAGTPVLHLGTKAGEVDGNGLLIPAVYEVSFASSQRPVVGVAVGVGIPCESEGRAGLIFTAITDGCAEEAEDLVTQMVNEGMAQKAITNYRVEVAAIDARFKGRPACAVAAAVFCDSTAASLFAGMTTTRRRATP